jgi:hypothetical protein
MCEQVIDRSNSDTATGDPSMFDARSNVTSLNRRSNKYDNEANDRLNLTTAIEMTALQRSQQCCNRCMLVLQGDVAPLRTHVHIARFTDEAVLAAGRLWHAVYLIGEMG